MSLIDGHTYRELFAYDDLEASGDIVDPTAGPSVGVPRRIRGSTNRARCIPRRSLPVGADHPRLLVRLHYGDDPPASRLEESRTPIASHLEWASSSSRHRHARGGWGSHRCQGLVRPDNRSRDGRVAHRPLARGVQPVATAQHLQPHLTGHVRRAMPQKQSCRTRQSAHSRGARPRPHRGRHPPLDRHGPKRLSSRAPNSRRLDLYHLQIEAEALELRSFPLPAHVFHPPCASRASRGDSCRWPAVRPKRDRRSC